MSDDTLKAIFDLEAKKLDDRIDLDGNTRLIIAAYKGRRDHVRAYISRGANIDKQNDLGTTAAIAVAYYGHLGIAEDLVAAKANLDLQGCGDNKITATMDAIITGHDDIALLYINAGADQSLRSALTFSGDRGGKDSLYFSARFVRERVLEKLIDMKVKDGTLVESSDALNGAIVWNEDAKKIQSVVTRLVAAGIDAGDGHCKDGILNNTYALQCARRRAKSGMEGWNEIVEIVEKARFDQGYQDAPDLPAYDDQGQFDDIEKKSLTFDEQCRNASLREVYDRTAPSIRRIEQELDDHLIDSLYNSIKRADESPSP
jgi:hypothetical protein